jgi:hypothetical protein
VFDRDEARLGKRRVSAENGDSTGLALLARRRPADAKPSHGPARSDLAAARPRCSELVFDEPIVPGGQWPSLLLDSAQLAPWRSAFLVLPSSAAPRHREGLAVHEIQIDRPKPRCSARNHKRVRINSRAIDCGAPNHQIAPYLDDGRVTRFSSQISSHESPIEGGPMLNKRTSIGWTS